MMYLKKEEITLKKICIISLICASALVGCSSSSQVSNENHLDQKVSKFTATFALKMAINHFNKDDREKLDYKVPKFPLSITVGKTVSKEVPVGGPVRNSTKLDMKNSVVPSGTNYIVTLTEDYHYVVNGTKAISYWKYDVSPNGVKLLGKSENGSIINGVK
jgi:hypothetical protein